MISRVYNCEMFGRVASPHFSVFAKKKVFLKLVAYSCLAGRGGVGACRYLEAAAAAAPPEKGGKEEKSSKVRLNFSPAWQFKPSWKQPYFGTQFSSV